MRKKREREEKGKNFRLCKKLLWVSNGNCRWTVRLTGLFIYSPVALYDAHNLSLSLSRSSYVRETKKRGRKRKCVWIADRTPLLRRERGERKDDRNCASFSSTLLTAVRTMQFKRNNRNFGRYSTQLLKTYTVQTCLPVILWSLFSRTIIFQSLPSLKSHAWFCHPSFTLSITTRRKKTKTTKKK